MLFEESDTGFNDRSNEKVLIHFIVCKKGKKHHKMCVFREFPKIRMAGNWSKCVEGCECLAKFVVENR